MHSSPSTKNRGGPIEILPPLDNQLIYSGDIAYHAAQPAREAAKRLIEDQQRQIDAFLPAFLTCQFPSRRSLVGTVWTCLADFAVEFADWDERERKVGFIHDLAPAARPGCSPTSVLARGSRLRLLDPYYEMWGVGYLAGTFFDLAVESGAMEGATVTVGDYARRSWLNGVPRRTIAAALLVPADSPEVRDPVAVQMRYERIVRAVALSGEREILLRSMEAVLEPTAVESDRTALGLVVSDTSVSPHSG